MSNFHQLLFNLSIEFLRFEACQRSARKPSDSSLLGHRPDLLLSLCDGFNGDVPHALQIQSDANQRRDELQTNQRYRVPGRDLLQSKLHHRLPGSRIDEITVS